jgi:hypothetical protein
MLSRAKMPVANGSAGGSFDALLQALAWRRNSPKRWGNTRERGQHERARSRVAFGQKQFSQGVDSNDKGLLWLLAPTKFDK